uniref:Uncharacterized protein n=1 Tax=Conchiformibius kuhniae TaxID=211502 RepID=A0A8T9MVC7_9NEIS|nr:hypothetical protein LVJ77_08195 [Conchiformibius kuhniae]
MPIGGGAHLPQAYRAGQNVYFCKENRWAQTFLYTAAASTLAAECAFAAWQV